MDASDLRLDGGERLLWSGTPRRGLVLQASDAFLIPFSLLWCAFVFMALSKNYQSEKSDPGLVMLPLFAAVGLYMLVGRFIYDIWRRANTFYALTNQRVVILSRFSEKSLPLATLSEIALKAHTDGRGTITFGSPLLVRYRRSTWSNVPALPAFEGIPDVRTVYDQLRRAQQESVRTPHA